ncbi:MAG TPA: MarR family winged helix-turn-helix transcriptional regulator [Acidimicrobiia bacterium]|nr:MarR family winged helix-turn-helix transcriptional regulator [Acidimicrobiia bacterium]
MATRAGREAWLTMVHLWFLDGYAHDHILDVAMELGLPPGMLKGIMHLGDDGVRMGDLAEQWSCDASYVTTITDGLESRGLAERRALASDRRVKTVVLTDAGRAVRARAMELLSEPPEFLDALSASEQRALRDLLRKVASAERPVPATSARTR